MTEPESRTATLFLDANVLISAAWKDGAEIALLWRMENVELVTSLYVMEEVQRNLPRIDQAERLRVLMRAVRVLTLGTLPEIDESLGLPPKDKPVLAGAIAAGADQLVSGDKKHFGPLYGRQIQGVRITSPPELLALLRRG
ncbi:MAG TPA: PIN domain-containing protein [Terracidiphilus sp.]|nr:PIN domain-containing protein [Terracidiphilus sp.]